WKMNPSKSKFEKKGPSELTITFDQKESTYTETLAIKGDHGNQTINLKYTADGKETTGQIDETDVKIIARWEGDALVVEVKAGQDQFIRKITVSPDGKTMTIAITRSEEGSPRIEESVVLEKQ